MTRPTMSCPECGEPLSMDAPETTCPYCGEVYDETESAPNDPIVPDADRIVVVDDERSVPITGDDSQ